MSDVADGAKDGLGGADPADAEEAAAAAAPAAAGAAAVDARSLAAEEATEATEGGVGATAWQILQVSGLSRQWLSKLQNAHRQTLAAWRIEPAPAAEAPVAVEASAWRMA